MMTVLIGWIALSVVGTFFALAMIRSGQREESIAFAFASANIDKTPYQIADRLAPVADADDEPAASKSKSAA